MWRANGSVKMGTGRTRKVSAEANASGAGWHSTAVWNGGAAGTGRQCGGLKRVLFWGFVLAKNPAESVAVLFDTRGENRYNSRMKHATWHVGCERKKVQKVSRKVTAMAQNVREICGPDQRIC